jgi:hypothetical protein
MIQQANFAAKFLFMTTHPFWYDLEPSQSGPTQSSRFGSSQGRLHTAPLTDGKTSLKFKGLIFFVKKNIAQSKKTC